LQKTLGDIGRTGKGGGGASYVGNFIGHIQKIKTFGDLFSKKFF